MMVKPNMPEENPLDSLVLAYPCPIQWDSMVGDERERFCEKCSMKVFNISDLPKSEAETFLRENSKSDELCVKFYLRSDGTIKTNNCPRFLRPIYRRLEWMRSGISFASMFIVSLLTGCSKTPDLQRPPAMGRPNLAVSEKIVERVLSVEPRSPVETKYLLDLKSSINLQRVLDTQVLSDLKNYYASNNQETKHFRIKLLQILLKAKEPRKECLLDSMLLSFEKERQQVLERLLNEAESQTEKKKYSAAWQTLSRYIDLSGCDLAYTATATALPDGVKKWTIVDADHKLRIIVLSEPSLQKAISLLQKMEPEIYPAILLKNQLLSAVKIEESRAVGNEEAAKEIIEKTEALAKREVLMNSDVIVIASHEGRKRVSTTEYLDVYNLKDFLKYPSNKNLPKRYVEDVLDCLTLEVPPPNGKVTEVAKGTSQYLIYLTDPKRSGDDLRHSTDYLIQKNLNEKEIQDLRDALEKKASYHL